MKKIIGILVALGLVLSMTVMATPVAADVTEPQVSVVLPCAGANAVYTITFNITASLTEGVHEICIKFPADTTVPTTYEDGDITVEGIDVFGDEVTVSGRTVCFLVPAHFTITDNEIVVVFTADAGILNPSSAGTYNLYVNTSRAPDETPVKSADYPISPAISEYEIVVDFSDTYPDLPEDFVPPFKACGQNSTVADFDTYYNTTTLVWFDYFDLILQTDGIPGCDTPCVNATVWGELTDAPAGGAAHLSLNGTWFTLDLSDVPDSSEFFVANVTLAENFTAFWDGLLHFDTVGDYEICFYVECPTTPVCQPPGSEIIVERCIPFKVYQWKDAIVIDLFRKWNLISLPIVPFETDIATLLLACNCSAEVDSIWYYDGCSEDWSTYPGAGLTDMEDGKAYWVKVDYSHTDAAKAPGLYAGVMWVWGVAVPMPPDSPSAYAVCAGWNMVGFRSMVSNWDDLYLWNFWDIGGGWPDYGTIYYWDAVNQGWLFNSPSNVLMLPGLGYFIPFEYDGTIYP